jgi:hypothetical protein
MFVRLLFCLFFVASPVLAAERGFSVTSFSRVRVEGPITVEITTGGSPAARAQGDRQAIDRLRVETNGDQLMIGMDRTNWTGESTATGNARAVIYVTTPDVASLSVIGAGDIRVDRARGSAFSLIVTGSGRARIDRLDVDQLTVLINGAGSATLAGQAKQVRIRSQGEGAIDGSSLTAADAEATLIGAGEIRLKASRSARNVLKGSGRIVIDGAPACTGTSEGSGEVVCGGSTP